MCGRYSLGLESEDYDELACQFGVELIESLPARFNIAPSQACPIVRPSQTSRELAMLRWGLVPAWAKKLEVGFSNINARAESVATKPAFRNAFQRRRCLVPATGFYEWKSIEGSRTKQPYHIHLKDRRLFSFAGLWERWRNGSNAVESFAIVTTKPNVLLASIHDRMPVILHPDAYDAWLDRDTPAEILDQLMRPISQTAMAVHPVSTFVNSPDHEGPECCEQAVPQEPAQGSLPF